MGFDLLLGDPMVCPSYHLHMLVVLACVLTNETPVPSPGSA